MDGGMLFLIDSHDFCLGCVDLEPAFLGFFVDSVELFLGVLVFVTGPPAAWWRSTGSLSSSL
jgi:hypothetical protein